MDRSFTKVKDNMRKLLFSNPKISILNQKNKILNSIKQVIENGVYIKGNQTVLFEHRFTEYLKAKYCIGTGNATDSIFLSLKAIGIKKNDEVITTSLTATATGLAIKNAGAKIKFLDVCEKYQGELISIDINANSKKFNSNKWTFVNTRDDNFLEIEKFIKNKKFDVIYLDTIHKADHVEKILFYYFNYLKNLDFFL